MVLAWSGDPLTLKAAVRPLEVVLVASSRCAAIFFALSRILRDAIAVAAPATGVERLA
jgi:hypothetical protein